MKIAKMTKTISSLSDVARQKGFKAASVLIFNSLSWYFPLFILFTNSVNQLNLVYSQLIIIFALHYATIVGSAFLGNHLVEKLGRNKVLLLWLILGVCSTGSLLLLSSSSAPIIGAISILLGLSLGLGFPSCLAYFGDNLPSERRGLIGGVTFTLTFIVITLIGVLTTMVNFNESVIGLSLWRLIGLLVFLLLKTERKIQPNKSQIPQHHSRKDIPTLLYPLDNILSG